MLASEILIIAFLILVAILFFLRLIQLIFKSFLLAYGAFHNFKNRRPPPVKPEVLYDVLQLQLQKSQLLKEIHDLERLVNMYQNFERKHQIRVEKQRIYNNSGLKL